jgi:hypothetical protein
MAKKKEKICNFYEKRVYKYSPQAVEMKNLKVPKRFSNEKE